MYLRQSLIEKTRTHGQSLSLDSGACQTDAAAAIPRSRGTLTGSSSVASPSKKWA